MSTVTLTAQNFDAEVVQSQTPVLVDFFATWCGPCRALSPVVHEIADDRAGRLKVCTCDIDQQPALASRFGVMSVPTLILFKDGKAVETMVGAQPKARLLASIDRHLG